jgi:hypothetical protein
MTIINTYAPNIGVYNFIKQALLDTKGHIGSYIIIVGDFNILLSSTDRLFGQEISKEPSELK